MPLERGTLLYHRYRIERILGQGGFGAVYLALDERLADAPCAIKENLNESPEAERQFRREATLLAALRHVNLPRVTNHFVILNHQYLVMDYVEGDDLRLRLEQSGPLPETDVLVWAQHIISALAYLHGHQPPIIHRDIKPANIKITPEGEAMLVDFGLAKTGEAGAQTSTGASGLTPGFAPPEQYGFAGTDARTDIYAFGATLYNLLTRQVPPESVARLVSTEPLTPPEQLRPDLSPHVTAVIYKALELKPEARFASIAELRDALADTTFRYQPGEAPAPEPVSTQSETLPAQAETTAPKRQPKRRGAGCWVTCAGVLALIVALVGGGAWFAADPARVQSLARDPSVGTQVSSIATQAVAAGLGTAIADVSTQVERSGWSTTVFSWETQIAQSWLGTQAAAVSTELSWPTLTAIGQVNPASPTARLTATTGPTAAPPPTGTPALTSTTLSTATPTPSPRALSAESGRAWRLFITWQKGDPAVFFALSPDGQSVAYPNEQGVDLFDIRSGETRQRLQGFVLNRKIVALAFLSDSLLVQFENEIMRWDVQQNRLIERLNIPGRDLRVSPDGRYMSVRGRYLSVYSLETRQLIKTVGDEASQQEIAFSPDGRYFALTVGNNVELYSLPSGRLERTLLGHGEPALGLAFTPDSKKLAAAGGDVWDLTTADPQPITIFDSAASRVAVSIDGSLIVGNDGAVWSLADGNLIGLLPGQPDGEHAERLQFTPDGYLLLWQAGGLPLRVWAADSPAARAATEPATPRAPREALTTLNISRLGELTALANSGYDGLRLSPNGARVLAWRGRQVDVLDWNSGSLLASFEGQRTVTEADFLGQDFVVTLNSRGLERWSIERRALMQTYPYTGARLEASPNGGLFAVQEKYIQVVDTVTGRLRYNLGTANSRQDFRFSPDGQYLAIAAEAAVGLWDTTTGQQARRLGGHGVQTRGLAFTPDGRRLVSASGDVWEMQGARTLPLATFETRATHLAVSPDGTLIVSEGGELWDGDSGQYLGRINLKADDIVITPDGQYLLWRNSSGGLGVHGILPVQTHAPPSAISKSLPALTALKPDNAPKLSLLGWWGDDALLDIRLIRDQVGPPVEDFGDGYRFIAPNPDGQTLMALTSNGVEVFTPAGQVLDRYEIFLNPDAITEITPLGQDLLVNKPQSGVERWDLRAQQLEQHYDIQGDELIASLDGQHFALRSGDEIVVMDAISGMVRLRARANAGPQNYTFTPDSQALLAANGLFVDRWDMKTGKRLGQLRGHGARVFGLSVTPDGARLIAASGDVWDMRAADGKAAATFAPGGSLGAVSADGALYVRDDGSVWEVAPSQRVATLFDYRAPAAQLLFAPSAPALLWRTTDARLYLWGVRAEAKLPAPLPDAITSANVLRLQRQTHLGRGRLLSAAWSPADQYLAVNTTENALVYALAGNALKLARAFLGQRVLTFDGEGRALMAGGGEPVRLVDVTTGQVTRRFKFADARAAAFSPDGQLLALAGPVTPGSQDDGLAVIELSDELTRISQPGRGRYKDTPKLEFSPDSQRLVVSYVGAITIWDLSANAPVRNTITSNTRPASLSPDGKLLAYFTDRFVIETLDKGGQYRTISAAGSEFFPGGINLPNYTPIDHVFTPGGKLLIYYRKLNQRTLQESVALVEWNADSPGANITVSDLFRLTGTPGLYVDDYERSRAIRVPAFGLSPTGQHLYSLTADGVARVWRYPAGQLLDASGTDYTDLLALHPNGQTVAVPNAFGHIELRDLNTGELKNELNGPWSPAGMVFNSPSLLLVAQPDEDEAGTLALVDTERNAVVETFQGPRYYRFGAMSGDGRLLAMWQIASGGVFLNVMPLSAARPLLELGRYPRPDELAFSPDSSRLAVVRGKQVEVWNLHTGQIAFKLSVQRNVVGNLAFSPDGARLIAASGEIWSASDGGLLATFDSTTDLIRLGPQGDFILGRDGTLWNVMTGQPIDQLPGLRGPAFHVAFTADGRRLVIQDDQGIIEVWGVS